MRKFRTTIFVTILLYLIIPASENLSLERKGNPMPNNSNSVTLHFSADNRLPFDWFADWIVFDAFIRGVYGTLTVLTPNGLFDLEHQDSLLEYIMTENSNPKILILGLKKNLFFEKENIKMEFTAEDIKFSYSIPFFLKENDIFEKSDLMKIKGMKNIVASGEYDADKVTGITVIDKYTVKIELENIDPNIITHLSTSKYPIVSKYFFMNKKKDELSPGLGKYKVLFINKESGETLLQRKNHIDGYPNFVRFISSVDKNGDIFWRDMWGNLGDSFKKEIINIPYSTTGIFFNYNTKLGKNIKFRKAISLAINRNKLIQNSDNIIANYQALPNGYWGRIETEETYNIELAKQLISEIEDLPNPFIIAVGASEKELQKPYYIELKQQLIDIGLNPIYSKKESYKPFETEMIVAGIAVPYRYPASVFQFFVEGSSFINAYPKNDHILQSKFDKLNISSSDFEKLKYSKELSLYINDNIIFVPLWDTLTEFVINNNKIKTLGSQSGGMVFDIWKVQLRNDI